MAEGVNTLTNGEDSTEETAKRGLFRRGPREPKVPRSERVKLSRKERKALGIKRGGKLKIILIILLVVLIAGFVYEELTINWLGTRDMLIEAVIRLDPDVRHREAGLDAREVAIAAEETDLAERTRVVQSREDRLVSRAAELDRKEAEIIEREIRATPIYRRSMSEQELADMVSLSRYYTQMAPASAAAILVEMTHSEDVAAILYYMAERNAAAILAVMEPEFAAEITSLLLYD